MKKALYAVLLGLIISIAPSLYAQSNAQESEYYYVSTLIEKVYTHRNGYVVNYRKGVNNMAQVYIPVEWFDDNPGKADLILEGTGPSWPRMVIFYKAGVFSHVRLFVRRDRGHPTWGVVPFYVNIDQQFKDTQEIRLEY